MSGTNVDATAEPGEPDHAFVGAFSSVWYTITPNQTGVVILDTFGSNFDTVLAVYTGNQVNNLDEVTSNDDAGAGFQSQVGFQAEAGTTYRIAVDGFFGDQGNLTLNFQQQDLSPNDDFDDAIALQGRRGSVAGNNIGATVEPGEPAHAGFGGVSSVWYSFTSNQSRVTTLQVEALDFAFSPVLAVYEGNSVNALTEVASSEFGSLAFSAEAGVTYRIAVDGDAGLPPTEGLFTLSFERTDQSPSPNDDFADAIALEGDSGSVAGNNIDATSEPGEPAHAGVGVVSSVWYTFTPTQTGITLVDTFGSSFDTVLAVYTGTQVDGLVEVTSNDDAGGALQSQVAFLAESGTTYRIAVDGFGGEQGVFTLNFERTDQLASPNDDFADAIALEGRSGSVTGNNVNATSEPGEPAHAGVGGISSVWYTFTPNRTGITFIDTSGSTTFDTVLAVYTGSQIDGLVEVASNDDSPVGTESQVGFLAEAGTTYRIAVDGFEGAQGVFTLNFQRTNQLPGPNDDFADAIVLEGRSGSVDGNNLLATPEPGEPVHAGLGAGSSVWYTFTPNQSGVATLDVFADAFSPVLAVYEGAPVDALDEVASSAVGTLAFFAEAGVTYRIAVDADDFGGQGLFTLFFRRNNQTPPVNDDFEDAIALDGRRGSVSGNSRQATREGGEPPHVSPFLGPTRSLWYSFTSNRTGVAFFDTFGSGFDSLLAVYTGDNLDSLVEVASNDDTASQENSFAPIGVQSQVAFLATRGVTHFVAVDGFFGDGGPVTLNFRQTSRRSPANDAFANPRVLGGESGVVSGFNVGASAEPGEPDHAGVSGPSSSAWWRWRAPFTGDVTFTTAGSNFDTVLAVYQGDAVGELEEITSNDDVEDLEAAFVLESLVRFTAQEGEVYRIAVDGFSGDQGSITLAFTRGNALLKIARGVDKT